MGRAWCWEQRLDRDQDCVLTNHNIRASENMDSFDFCTGSTALSKHPSNQSDPPGVWRQAGHSKISDEHIHFLKDLKHWQDSGLDCILAFSWRSFWLNSWLRKEAISHNVSIQAATRLHFKYRTLISGIHDGAPADSLALTPGTGKEEGLGPTDQCPLS